MTASAILPVIAAIVGAITGGGIGFLTARCTSISTERAAAAGKLRAAFIPELVALRFDRNKDKFDADKLLREAFPRHAQAVEQYRFYVNAKDQEAYEKAWKEYYEVGGSVRFFDYMMGDDPVGCFETRVRAILRYAR